MASVRVRSCFRYMYLSKIARKKNNASVCFLEAAFIDLVSGMKFMIKKGNYGKRVFQF